MSSTADQMLRPGVEELRAAYRATGLSPAPGTFYSFPGQACAAGAFAVAHFDQGVRPGEDTALDWLGQHVPRPYYLGLADGFDDQTLFRHEFEDADELADYHAGRSTGAEVRRRLGL